VYHADLVIFPQLDKNASHHGSLSPAVSLKYSGLFIFLFFFYTNDPFRHLVSLFYFSARSPNLLA
jgi:hypothetical protein